jgi:adenine-specific DNA-methyltransferase
VATGIPKTKSNGNGSSAFANGHIQNSPDLILAYPGKRSEQEILAIQSSELIAVWNGEQFENGVPQNRLYYGDNLGMLSALINDRSIQGQVRLVYIDPPFSTNSAFQSRAQVDAYDDLLIGAPYVEFLRERLILLREILAENGSIYIHLDENMAFPIKIIMDEIFGRKNFRNWITRKKSNPKNYTRKTYGNISDFILFYTKSDEYVWNRPFAEWTTVHAEKEYSYIETETGRRFKKVPLHAPGVRHGETGKPWKGMNPPPGKHWQFTPHTLDEMDARGEIYWSANGNPRRKIYLEQSVGVPVQDIWLDFKDAHNQNIKVTGYPTEKNPALLARIVEASSNPGDLVLDCFAGSGTTLAVASQLERRWIGIDRSRQAIETILHRFARGLEPMGDFVNNSKTAKDKSPRQPALFSPTPKMIKDFTLYTTQENRADLTDILVQWRKMIG